MYAIRSYYAVEMEDAWALDVGFDPCRLSGRDRAGLGGVAERLGSMLKDNPDPMIGGLMEGAAFLAARVQLKLKHEFATSSGAPARRIAYCERRDWSMSGFAMSRITSYNVCYTKLLRTVWISGSPRCAIAS